MSVASLQWGGRFTEPPDPYLLAFGSSLEDDLVLAPFDVRCSQAHVAALAGGNIVTPRAAAELIDALEQVGREIDAGSFTAYARSIDAEDVHGAIDARVRELTTYGEWLHAGRSRNDQVATTLALYARERCESAAARSAGIARATIARAKEELAAGTMLAATTHWQPAQPVLLAFWLCAAAEPFLRAAERFLVAAEHAQRSCPLGSSALAGSGLPLDRRASSRLLGFGEPSRNAIDAIGSRDVALDAADAFVRACVDASRISGELVIWCTPAFGYARAGDASSTGSSLMPQKRNPDTFELVRAGASELLGAHAGALSTLCGIGLSYHRDLQQVKRLAMQTIERGTALLRAFEIGWNDLHFDRDAMSAHAGDGFTVATDIADALILAGVSARRAHALVGEAVARAEAEARPFDASDLAWLAQRAEIGNLSAPLDPRASIESKRTGGSTAPFSVAQTIDALEHSVDALGFLKS